MRLAYAALVTQGVALLAFFFAGQADIRFLAFWILAAALVVLGLVALSLRCRVCGEFVFIWAWGQRNIFSALRLEACPQCGARDDTDDLARRTTPPEGPGPARGAGGGSSLSFDRVRQPRRFVGLTYVILGMVATMLVRLLADLLR